jgi:LmbE family N-acetylglucosaminyl deacetylase
MPANVLVVAPHPDDETIGCGGALCLHASRGDRVAVAFLTSGELGLQHLPREEAWRTREAEAEAAAAVLGLARLKFLRYPDWFLNEHIDEAAGALREVLEQESPQIIYAPHAREWHPDHQAALTIVRRALNNLAVPPVELLTYEVWTPLGRYDRVLDITAVMTRKLQAVRCYRSQLVGFRYDRAVKGLNQYRGCLAARCRYAEVFQEEPAAEGGG